MIDKSKRRSKLEEKFEDIIKGFGATYDYEVTTLPYTVPSSDHKYTPDWTFNSGLLVETKGLLADYAERQKYLLIKEQYPNIDLRFVFVNNQKKCGGMQMTHAQWAQKNGFKYCDIKDVETIKSWVEETK